MSVSTTMEAALRHAQTQPPLLCAAVRQDTILPATDLLAMVCPLNTACQMGVLYTIWLMCVTFAS